ncbi:DoxX-like family protein [Paraoerskovia marina]|uniref:DoxX-like family protein n=1 Tax=Paraoerskovia marina TaxID=545619 RepID=A0A1H1MHP1_9CELL|nr:DoxX family protein [Paraoerskovia marina]SDR85479.1 DoxX-like family protein [Paraoerskovia marina]
MTIAAVVLSVLLGLASIASAAGKLSGKEQPTAPLRDVGVPERMFSVLALLLLAGGVGLLVGIWWTPIGIAAAAGLTLYFLGAVIAHLRVGDKKIQPAVLLTLVAAATLVLLVLAG